MAGSGRQIQLVLGQAAQGLRHVGQAYAQAVDASLLLSRAAVKLAEHRFPFFRRNA
nr:hypothetical protein [Methylogaea oryzae]